MVQRHDVGFTVEDRRLHAVVAQVPTIKPIEENACRRR
jgi:hypothetical protein